MAMTYVNIQDRVEQILQDIGAATYTTTITGMWIEDGLKEFSPYDPHIVPVIFKIESRTGTDVTGTASSLTDLVELQFVAADATDEKVVHNITDDTWAVVLANSSTSVNTLSADIMDANEQYEIYNKRCWNEKQIYIGDVLDYLWIDSVEYPIGEKRNWRVYGEVLEIDVDSVDDSDSTLTTLGQVDVLVRFAKPHRICQLTDLAGACTAIEPVGETTLAVKGLLGAEVIEIGDELHIENQRTLYTVTTGVTLAGAGAGNGTGDIVVYPGMEVATVVDDIITFTQSTLKPQHEELFCHLVAVRALISEANAQLIQAKADMTAGRLLINTVNKGGAGTSVATAYIAYARAEEELAREQRRTAYEKLTEVIGKMEALSPPRTKRRYSTA